VTKDLFMHHDHAGVTVYACCGAEVGSGGHHDDCPYVARQEASE
jgi:hypothetical protein